MAIIGTVQFNELSVVRDGSTAIVTLTNVPFVDIFIKGTPSAITPNQDEFIAYVYHDTSEDDKTIKIIRVTKVYEYTIDEKTKKVLTLKFAFTDRDIIVAVNEIKPLFSEFVRHGTALAVKVNGAFGEDVTSPELEDYMRENYSVISHFGVTYHFVNVAAKLVVSNRLRKQSAPTDFHRSFVGLIAVYSSILPSSSNDCQVVTDMMKNLLINR